MATFKQRLLEMVPSPDCPWFLRVVVIASAACMSYLVLRSGFGTFFSGALLVISAGMGVESWIRLEPKASREDDSEKKGEVGTSRRETAGMLSGTIALAAGCALSVIAAALEEATYWGWGLAIFPFALIWLRSRLSGRVSMTNFLFVPLLSSLIFLSESTILGVPEEGAFPAVFAVLLILIFQTTRRAEKIARQHPPSPEEPSHVLTRRASSWISVLFFLFGVVAIWPWLGKMYGNTYFWVLLLGVLLPVMYLWGRLRQPRHEDPMLSLSRFNRLAPYTLIPLLVAIVLG